MDLVLISYLRSDESAASSYLRVMVNSGSVTATGGYTEQGVWGNGSTSTGSLDTSTIQGIAGYMPADSAGANIFGSAITTIHDINSGKHKTIETSFASDTVGSGYVGVFVTTRNTQAPVTSVYLSLYPTGSDDLVAGSRVDLFGILPRMVS
jgi:hypothetical protein